MAQSSSNTYLVDLFWQRRASVHFHGTVLSMEWLLWDLWQYSHGCTYDTWIGSQPFWWHTSVERVKNTVKFIVTLHICCSLQCVLKQCLNSKQRCIRKFHFMFKTASKQFEEPIYALCLMSMGSLKGCFWTSAVIVQGWEWGKRNK